MNIKDRKSITAVPTVSNVIIIGEAVTGGTVRGSYKYENIDQNPEGPSIYQWYLDDLPLPALTGDAIDLRIRSDYADKRLTFSVLPVAASGERGVETFSAAKVVNSHFQGVSHEESDNSYLKQWGNFSFHISEPPDRVFVSTGGAFALIDPDTQDIYFEGQEGWGLPVPADISNFFKNNPASRFFSTEKDFAALVDVFGGTQLFVWGANIPTTIPVKLTDVKAVYSNRECFAFIYDNATGSDDRIGAVGLEQSGGIVPADLQSQLYFDEPVAIHATQNAFAVRTKNGKVYAWGNPANGGLIDDNARALLDGIEVERIIAAATAFCAIGTFGEIVTWGVAGNGGSIPAAQIDKIVNDGGVISVIAATTAFCAITRNNRKAVSWGMVAEGGQMSASAELLAVRGGVMLCKANRWSFCLVNNMGQAEAWGAQLYGGASLTEETKQQIQAAVNDHSIDIKQDQALNNAPVGSRIITLEGNLSLYSNDVSFFLLSQGTDARTRAVVVWGYSSHGGAMDLATRQALMASEIASVYCTNGAFGVVTTQGSVYGAVIVWGATLAMEDAGEIPAELAQYLKSDVVELYSIKRFPYIQAPPPPPPKPAPIDPSFAARRRDGSYVLWGGNVTNQYYKPTPARDVFKHHQTKRT